MKRLLYCTRANAAVEAAIFMPVFLLLTLGITDLGVGMFVKMTANAAAQAGAAYAFFKTNSTCTAAPITATCLSGIKMAMNDAAANPTFCTGSACIASVVEPCADGTPQSKCVIVTANWSYTPILPSAVYAWGKPQTYSSTATVRVQ
jgi:hypothetical protein